MDFRFSKHALEKMEKRAIERGLVELVLADPQQRVAGHDDIVCYQSTVDMAGKSFLLRVMVKESVSPHLVVTVYRTSKIGKYQEGI